MQVTVSYKDKDLRNNIKNPTRKQQIRKLAQKSYTTLASAMVKSDKTSNEVIVELSRKIKCEMKHLYSSQRRNRRLDSVHSWESVFMEMGKGLPTLIKFLSHLIPRPKDNIPLVYMIASQLVKGRHERMSLVQRTISTMFYGHGMKKQVYNVG